MRLFLPLNFGCFETPSHRGVSPETAKLLFAMVAMKNFRWFEAGLKRS